MGIGLSNSTHHGRFCIGTNASGQFIHRSSIWYALWLTTYYRWTHYCLYTCFWMWVF